MRNRALTVAAFVAALSTLGVVSANRQARACDECAEHAGKGAKAQSCSVDKILAPYFTVRKRLAADSLEGVAKATAHLAKCQGCIAKFDDGAFKTAMQAYVAAARTV